ncbi:retrovirus-related pol polyprotein from transposon tnt 1-94 [Trichonephila inaurata madagascariensis]|uniref:Retrovirus-related pol polyprotein from transposon tnt 1-94 n=1 Tax=Trichonephila inaurata madagascariensis TaxID=2747483 RepID=A0A8X6WXN1_9ARAC|nr:retrovirus-related pol polyprotein from transposon tnt 1-94 [Trichonephila inaurata madagascariensis]
MHVTNCSTYFADFIKFNSPCGIKSAGNETLVALEKVTVKVKSTINEKFKEVFLKIVVVTALRNTELDKELCEPCIYGKAHRLSFDTRKKPSEPGELIFADVCGSFNESFQKKMYMGVFKDRFTKFHYGYLIKEKSEVKEMLDHMLAHTRTLGYSVKEFFCDNGGEFDNKDVREIYIQMESLKG